jgi:hypothetical protein
VLEEQWEQMAPMVVLSPETTVMLEVKVELQVLLKED